MLMGQDFLVGCCFNLVLPPVYETHYSGVDFSIELSLFNIVHVFYCNENCCNLNENHSFATVSGLHDVCFNMLRVR